MADAGDAMPRSLVERMGADGLAAGHSLWIRLARSAFVHGADRWVDFGVRTAGDLELVATMNRGT
jgi:hypothetical protein